MKIIDSKTLFSLTVTDKDRASWINGEDIWYKTHKDYRPDLNPYDHLFGVAETPYSYLYDICKELPLNEVPEEVMEGLKNLKVLSEIVSKYQDHVTGLILKARVKVLKARSG